MVPFSWGKAKAVKRQLLQKGQRQTWAWGLGILWFPLKVLKDSRREPQTLGSLGSNGKTALFLEVSRPLEEDGP